MTVMGFDAVSGLSDLYWRRGRRTGLGPDPDRRERTMKPKLNVVTPPMAARPGRLGTPHPAPPGAPQGPAAVLAAAPSTPPAPPRIAPPAILPHDIVEVKEPTEAMIRQRAYEIYEEGGRIGDALGDWLRAESELKEEFLRRRG